MMKRHMTLNEELVNELDLASFCTRYVKKVDGEMKTLFHVADKNVKVVKRKILDSKIRVKTIMVFESPDSTWVKVKREELVKLGIEDVISEASRENKEDVFLDNLVDRPVYEEALRARYGENTQFILFANHGGKLSRVRNYPHFSPMAAEENSEADEGEEAASN